MFLFDHAGHISIEVKFKWNKGKSVACHQLNIIKYKAWKFDASMVLTYVSYDFFLFQNFYHTIGVFNKISRAFTIMLVDNSVKNKNRREKTK